MRFSHGFRVPDVSQMPAGLDHRFSKLTATVGELRTSSLKRVAGMKAFHSNVCMIICETPRVSREAHISRAYSRPRL